MRVDNSLMKIAVDGLIHKRLQVKGVEQWRGGVLLYLRMAAMVFTPLGLCFPTLQILSTQVD